MSIASEEPPAPSSSPPNRSNWPIASLRLTSMTASTASSQRASSALRVCPIESKAPARIRDWMVRLLHTTCGTLSRKSWKEAKRPFSSRAPTIASTTGSPTFWTALSPKRMASPSGAKLPIEAFTSGGSTVMSMWRHSARYRARRSLLSFVEVSRAAMYSVG